VGGHKVITDLLLATCKCTLLSAWEARHLWAQRTMQFLCLFSPMAFISYNCLSQCILHPLVQIWPQSEGWVVSTEQSIPTSQLNKSQEVWKWTVK